MTIKLTKYYVEVAGQNTDGVVKVFRQYVDVLYLPSTGNTWNEDGTDTLNLAHTAVANSVKNLTDTLDFQQTAVKASSNYVTLVGLAINATDLIVYSDTPKRP